MIRILAICILKNLLLWHNIDGDVAPEVGTRAYHMLGREPMGLEVIRPIINGSVPRMEVFRALLIYFLKPRSIKEKDYSNAPCTD